MLVSQCLALKRYRPMYIDKKCNSFFIAPDFINSVIFTVKLLSIWMYGICSCDNCSSDKRWKLFILSVISNPGLSFSGFAINFSLILTLAPKPTESQLGLCSDGHFFHLCVGHLFLIMTPRSIKFGWKFPVFYWVISYPLSFLGFAINLSSCLEGILSKRSKSRQ